MFSFPAFNESFDFDCYFVITTFDNGYSDVEHFVLWSEALSAYENEIQKTDRSVRLVYSSSLNYQRYLHKLDSIKKEFEK